MNSNHPRHILVTGGAGFIGSHACDALLAAGHTVRCMDNLATSYLAALVADVEAALPLVWGRPVVSLFFGGGTPSLLSPAGVERLLADLRMRLPIQPDAEITLEANPGTVETGRFAEFREAGITRVSLGIQSFDDEALRVLGRIHGAAEARVAAEVAARHFAIFNLDLMYGLPARRLPALLPTWSSPWASLPRISPATS